MFFFRAVIHLLIRSKIYQYIAYQRSIRLNLYLISLGVITSPVEISIFNGVITPSNFVSMLTRTPG